jgi:hypothetical protein
LWTAAIVVSRTLPRLGGVPRVAAFGVVATAVLVVVHLLPGIAGVLSREAVLILATVALLAAWRLVPQRPGGDRLDPPEPIAESGPVSWGIVAVAGIVLAVAVLAEVTVGIRYGPTDGDSLTFGLPNIGSWIQDGSVWSVNQFVPLQAHGNYPNNGDLMFLAVMLPFDADFLVQLVTVPFYLLTLLAVFGIGSELGAPRAAAALTALMVGALPIMHLATFTAAKTDPVFYAALGAAILFALRWLRLRRWDELVLAGVAFGLALGTKWYAVTAIPIIIGAWAVAALVSRRGSVRTVLTGGATLIGLTALFGGFWMLRNWVGSGSPLFPQGVPLLAHTPHDYVRDCVGFSVADYLGKPDVLREFIWPAMREALSLGGLVLAVGWLCAGVAAVRSRRRGQGPGPAVWLLLGAAVVLAAAYVITPYTALGGRDRPAVAGPNVRYLVPAVIAVAPLVAWWIGRLGRGRVVAEVICAIALLEGIRRGFDVPARNWALGAAALVAAAAVAFAFVRLHARYPRRIVVVGAGALVALVAVIVSYDRQDEYMSDRFATAHPAVRALAALPAGERVGLAGYYNPGFTAPVWPAFGPRIENRVEYIGHFHDGQLREFSNAAEWRRRVEERGYDVVVVAYDAYPRECALPGSESDDNAFAREAGYRLVGEAPNLTVYRVR